jgi:hypothetical protein
METRLSGGWLLALITAFSFADSDKPLVKYLCDFVALFMIDLKFTHIKVFAAVKQLNKQNQLHNYVTAFQYTEDSKNSLLFNSATQSLQHVRNSLFNQLTLEAKIMHLRFAIPSVNNVLAIM